MEMVLTMRKPKLDFEETELRLGLPGIGNNTTLITTTTTNANGKRCFSETSSIDLKLNLSSSMETSMNSNEKIKEKQSRTCTNDQLVNPPPTQQVVGWPPVRNFRKNTVAVEKRRSSSDESGGGGGLVKVSMDGAPYLRKVDLKMYNTYQHLSHALSQMFTLFTTGNTNNEGKGMINYMQEKKLMDLVNNSSDFVPTYQDKDGDWMLVGDVPWEMFVESCNRLRIIKGTEAAGLAPKAMEKCKNRS